MQKSNILEQTFPTRIGKGGKNHISISSRAPMYAETPQTAPRQETANILVVTGNLALVLALRSELRSSDTAVTWTNDFWIAMSHIHNNRFSGLILDLATLSVEQTHLPDALREYDVFSTGNKILLSSDPLHQPLKRQIKRLKNIILSRSHDPEDLLEDLGICDSSKWYVRASMR